MGAHETKESKRRLKRPAVAALAAALCALAVVGVVFAWLVAQTDPVVNTFTYGDVNINLTETDTGLDGDDNKNTNQYVMLPGQTIAKDPKLTVEKNSVESWLFVKLEKSSNFDSFLEYTVADGWAQLKDAEGKEVEGVYCREVSKSEADQEFTVIKDDKVTVKDTVTKAQLNALDSNPESTTYPKLTVTGYAVQKAGFETAAAAWKVATGE